MNFSNAHRIQPGQRAGLSAIDTKRSGPFADKQDGEQFTAKMNDRIRQLQYRLFVEGQQSLLVVLQAPDAAGKDGVIREVLGRMNPQGCRTYPFKAPSEEERAHDFLWRIHKCTPAKGMVSIFNRSHYEDVLVVRVNGLVPEPVWRQRYERINHFESNLVAAGTRILKFYLHISPQEQLQRFRDRLNDPASHWKLNVGDYAARDQWDSYLQAYEDAIEKCNSADAPWFVIPADRKWYRDAAVAGIVCETLEQMDPQLPPVSVDLEQIRALYERELAELNVAKP
jgi:PPK2 family polyphosphate:nucleotide phosphotransferase